MLSHDLLMGVERPGRYVDSEWEAVKKNLSRVDFKVCLCFPDVYEIGMSHLGLRILYEIINSKRNTVCERAFCPWPDYKEKLIERSLPLTSLEHDIALKDFDLLGFSVNNELNYSNILSMLSLGAVPLLAKERDSTHPLVVAGGNCMLNPEPLAGFFDVCVIGEAEEVIVEIINVCQQFKKKRRKTGVDKDALLYALSRIRGVYVPQFYHVEYHDDMTVKRRVPLRYDVPDTIKKVFIKDLNKSLYPSQWIVPNIQIIHDRIGIEIMRGCVHQCRFCQARTHFSPLRMRSEKHILKMAKKLYKISGYEEISLLSLSSSDHPHIESIIRSLAKHFKGKGVNIALPSMRAKSVVGSLSTIFADGKKTGLTFAPEAGSERLRKIINKNINIDELFTVTKDAYSAGYRRIKLYFMIGLPSERESDLDGIAELSSRLSQLKKEVGSKSAEVTISISSFIPKPHTPFQWAPMITMREIRERQSYIRSKIAGSAGRLRVNFHSASMSKVESALSRGSRKLSSVILEAFKMGAQFDQWNDHFNFEIWSSAFRKNGLDVGEEATRGFDLDRVLSWDFIDAGVCKGYLKDEFRKALT